MLIALFAWPLWQQVSVGLVVVLGLLALLALYQRCRIAHISETAQKTYLEISQRYKDQSVEEVARIVAVAENAFTEPLNPNKRKRVTFADPGNPAQTDFCIVFVHGWSASAPEVSPFVENLGRAHKVNCFFTRMPGHGWSNFDDTREELSQATMVSTMLEALAVGQALGNRVLLVGTSAGGTLCAWLACQTWARSALMGCILLSVNVRTRPVLVVRVLTNFPILRRLALELYQGRTQAVADDVKEDQKALVWLSWPTSKALITFDICAMLANAHPDACSIPVLAFHNPKDYRCDYKATQDFVSSLPQGRLVTVEPEKDEHQHVVTGIAYAPSTLPLVQAAANEWLTRILEAKPN